MLFLFALLAGGLSLMLLSHFIQCLVFPILNVAITEIRVFYGRPLMSFTWGRTVVKLGWVPFGASTSYDVDRFARLPLPLRVFVCLIPPLFLVVLGLLILGADRGWHHLLSGFWQFFDGALHPREVGASLVGKIHSLYDRAPVESLGVLALKIAAVALLPFSTVGGIALLECVPRAKREERLPQMFLMSGLLLIFLSVLTWAVVLAVHVFRG